MNEVHNHGCGDVWGETPPDIAERVAALLSRILSEQFDAKVTVVAERRMPNA